MKSVITILLLALTIKPGTIFSQVIPPPPPPPTPKVYYYDTSPGDDRKKDDYGYRSLRIATFGNYQLGMTTTEYDSLSKLGDLVIKTDKQSYSVTLKPSFTMQRLTSLVMESKTDSSKSELNSFARMIALDYRDADSVITKETENKQINSEWYWHNKLHNMTILMSRIELPDGTWKGSFTIKFEGNKDYFDLLKSLDKLGD